MKFVKITLSTTTTLITFLINKKNASCAEEQKFFPWIAHIMYAFLLTKHMNLCKHQKQHFNTQKIALVNAFSYFFNFSSTNSKIVLRNEQIAMMREPNATVPRWYLKQIKILTIKMQQNKLQQLQKNCNTTNGFLESGTSYKISYELHKNYYWEQLQLWRKFTGRTAHPIHIFKIEFLPHYD